MSKVFSSAQLVTRVACSIRGPPSAMPLACNCIPTLRCDAVLLGIPPDELATINGMGNFHRMLFSAFLRLSAAGCQGRLS